jgi:metal-responsive CopG/Arc/MetJ family transcriptional regulator
MSPRGRPITQLEPLDQRVQLMMTASELADVDEWAIANAVRGRSQAIRQLIRAGLDAQAPAPAPAKKARKAAE